jgi:hypothetical protein
MKPLVLWCRWHDATLRLQGRSRQEVWGELAYETSAETFRYDLVSRELTRGMGERAVTVKLDDMGVEVG